MMPGFHCVVVRVKCKGEWNSIILFLRRLKFCTGQELLH